MTTDDDRETPPPKADDRKNGGTKADRRGIGLGDLGALAVAVLLLVGGLIYLELGRLERLTAAQSGACARLQVERERLNVADAIVYVVLGPAAASTRSTEAGERFANGAAVVGWAPPADCPASIDHPATYRPHDPIPYAELPPCFADEVILAARDKRPQPTPSQVDCH